MRKILLVDDNEVFLAALSALLVKRYGDWEIITAHNGKEAVAILQSEVIDLLISDLHMPIMDGYELLKYVKKNHPFIQVVLMTGAYSSETGEKLCAIGEFECVEKPHVFKIIADMINRKLDMKEHEGTFSLFSGQSVVDTQNSGKEKSAGTLDSFLH